MLQLRKITTENYLECLNLHTDVTISEFVDSVTFSLAEAWVYYDVTHPFAIYKDHLMIGYVSMYSGDNNPQIINFMIDSRYQRLGYGKMAAKLCIDYLCQEHQASRISLPVHLNNKIAINFWGNLGFKASDNVEDSYLYMRLQL